ncbi:SAF domain-containing protein [Paenibacillus koleovorans]|uniref:SAF domain-containing protein n=1 Tax=Paenibacillus koleovorans TaxID=121608 RepID=UPI000FD8748D|nr:SAF domain-containing protein [Paenibacillus koleovorans]
MSRGKSLLISLTAALLAGALVYGVYVLQLKQVQLQETVSVLAPKHFIPAGTLITAEMVERIPVTAGSFRAGMAADASTVIGAEAIVPLGTREPIWLWKVDRFHLLPNASQSTFQIPKDYILSLSNGIRAGDSVEIYLSSGEGDSRKLFDHEIRVASVKSSANVEVDNPKQSNLMSRINSDAEMMYASRTEANGPIDQINLNLTGAEWLEIDRICKTKKAKLVIALTASSIKGEATQ